MAESGYMAAYIFRVPGDREEAWLRIVGEAGRIVLQHGALACEVYGAGDLSARYGGMPFGEALEVGEGEKVFVELIRFRDRAHHDEVMARVDDDERISGLCDELTSLIDVRRVVRGEFERRV